MFLFKTTHIETSEERDKRREEEHKCWLEKHKKDGSHTYFICKRCKKEDWYWTHLGSDKRELCNLCKQIIFEKKQEASYCKPREHNYLGTYNIDDGIIEYVCSKCGKRL